VAEIIPRKTVVELRYPAKLSFVSKVEQVGETLLDRMETEHWERSAFSLQILDKKRRQRVILESKRLGIECDGPIAEQREATIRGYDLLADAARNLGIDKVARVGVRQWFALEIGGNSEQKLIEKLCEAHLRTKLMERAMKMSVQDFAIILELQDKTDPQFTGRISYGVMPRDQWGSQTPYQKPSHLGSDGVKQIVDELPNEFVFVDVDKRIDSGKTDSSFSLERCKRFTQKVQGDLRLIPKQLIDDIRESQP
tara:strand:+ start:19359 stop:20117 length:759 start_codon:yes stop_codon:yes gene_type:complete